MRCSRYATVTVVILACLAGCGPPESDRPLSDPELAKRDARLTGVWGLSGPGDRAVYLHFGGDRDEAVTDVVVVLHEDGVEVVRFGMFTTVIQGHHYMNLREKSLGDDEKGEPGKRGRYIFAKYAISKDGLLTISLMDVPYVAAAVRGGKLKGAASKSSHAIQSVRLTDESPKIADFVRSADHARLFETFGVFKKLPAPTMTKRELGRLRAGPQGPEPTE